MKHSTYAECKMAIVDRSQMLSALIAIQSACSRVHYCACPQQCAADAERYVPSINKNIGR